MMLTTAVETNQNRPTAPGLCYQCGRAPCDWLVPRTGLCCDTPQPVTERDIVMGIIYDGADKLPGMTFAEVLEMVTRVVKARTV